MSFTTPEDIGNRALQHVGSTRLFSFTDNTKQAAEVSFCYEKLRRAELRRSVWRFATRRATLRAVDAGTLRFIAPVWLTATHYSVGSIVKDSSGIYWQAFVAHDSTAVNAPGTNIVGQPQFWQQYFGVLHGTTWSNSITYYAGEVVYLNSAWYVSIVNGNLNHAVGTAAYWTPLNVTVSVPVFFPIAAGPGVTVQGLARNIFPLPNGYLRVTYQDPKVASTATNVTSGGLQFSDWQFEGNLIISASPGPLALRFVADVSDVTAMDDLFCEGLGARIGYEICETLTQSNIKLQAIGAAYQKFIKDARLINWLETASNERQEEEYELTQGPANVSEGSPVAQGANGGR